ncbi:MULTISPECIES: hypothetical protein [unclassified Polynucleobacter]|uniref:hypothetical protein n=1 Tax=unclassified Polynucleobacter TaxID=2640945 RepID=UPI0025E6A77D|nr:MULTISPECIES: hypothetical protein [unclassified Polynucleobacter]
MPTPRNVSVVLTGGIVGSIGLKWRLIGFDSVLLECRVSGRLCCRVNRHLEWELSATKRPSEVVEPPLPPSHWVFRGLWHYSSYVSD